MIKIKITVGRYTKTAIGAICGINLIFCSSYGIAYWYDQSTDASVHDNPIYFIMKWSFSLLVTMLMFAGFLKFIGAQEMHEQEK